SYDENSSVLTFKWSFKDYSDINGKSELFVPKHRYPNGYQVIAKNCQVISGPPNKTKLVVFNNISGNSFDGEIIIMPIVK
ncbi:MAG: hypothetical protein GQ474_09185, partial [Sulfurimonas sp.]|nr:hypothetical protein [Sulfurimonas sp.]